MPRVQRRVATRRSALGFVSSRARTQVPQATLMPDCTRTPVIHRRTGAINALRGHLAEFGLVFASQCVGLVLLTRHPMRSPPRSGSMTDRRFRHAADAAVHKRVSLLVSPHDPRLRLGEGRGDADLFDRQPLVCLWQCLWRLAGDHTAHTQVAGERACSDLRRAGAPVSDAGRSPAHAPKGTETMDAAHVVAAGVCGTGSIRWRPGGASPAPPWRSPRPRHRGGRHQHAARHVGHGRDGNGTTPDMTPGVTVKDLRGQCLGRHDRRDRIPRPRFAQRALRSTPGRREDTSWPAAEPAGLNRRPDRWLRARPIRSSDIAFAHPQASMDAQSR